MSFSALETRAKTLYPSRSSITTLLPDELLAALAMSRASVCTQGSAQGRGDLQMAVKCRGKFLFADIILMSGAMVVVEEKESNATPGPTELSQPGKSRLVIRVVIPQESAPQTTNPSRVSSRAVALSLVVAAIMLTWLGFNLFSSHPPDTRVAGEEPSKVDGRSQVRESKSGETAPRLAEETPPELNNPAADVASAEGSSSTRASTNETSIPSASNETSIPSASQKPPDAPPSPIDQVIPDVPRSALQTIRGTVRVAIQVSIDKEGTVRSATAKDPGPSRYFERLSLEAARKWTFSPSASNKERIMLIRFHYTQEGATAHPSLPDE